MFAQVCCIVEYIAHLGKYSTLVTASIDPECATFHLRWQKVSECHRLFSIPFAAISVLIRPFLLLYSLQIVSLA